jgi:hypothetical protein
MSRSSMLWCAGLGTIGWLVGVFLAIKVADT